MTVCWVLSNIGITKINVDGNSLRITGCDGIEGLLRNKVGSWIMDFFDIISIIGNLFVELMAIPQFLTMAWNQGYRRMMCESDSNVVVKFHKLS